MTISREQRKASLEALSRTFVGFGRIISEFDAAYDPAGTWRPLPSVEKMIEAILEVEYPQFQLEATSR